MKMLNLCNLLINVFSKHLSTAVDSTNHFSSNLSPKCKHLAISGWPGSDATAHYQLKQCDLYPSSFLFQLSGSVEKKCGDA